MVQILFGSSSSLISFSRSFSLPYFYEVPNFGPSLKQWMELEQASSATVVLCCVVLCVCLRGNCQFPWKRRYIHTYNSSKSPARCNNFPVYCPDVYLQLNMFRAFSRPSSGALTAVAASSFTFVSWWYSCCVRGRASPTTNTARLSPRYEGNTKGSHYSHWAPDDGRQNTRNMLSCQ
jgi:hypothetical protein